MRYYFLSIAASIGLIACGFGGVIAMMARVSENAVIGEVRVLVLAWLIFLASVTAIGTLLAIDFCRNRYHFKVSSGGCWDRRDGITTARFLGASFFATGSVFLVLSGLPTLSIAVLAAVGHDYRGLTIDVPVAPMLAAGSVVAGAFLCNIVLGIWAALYFYDQLEIHINRDGSVEVRRMRWGRWGIPQHVGEAGRVLLVTGGHFDGAWWAPGGEFGLWIVLVVGHRYLPLASDHLYHYPCLPRSYLLKIETYWNTDRPETRPS